MRRWDLIRAEREGRDLAWRQSQVRAHQTDGSASASALRWGCARTGCQCGPRAVSEGEGYEGRGWGGAEVLSRRVSWPDLELT